MNSRLGLLNIKLQPPLQPQGYNKSIEQYRGLCAILVLIAHATGQEQILVDNFKWPEFIRYLGAGYLSVIVFFCLSGYVIGISNDVTKLNVEAYIKKRLIRLYPVYIAAFIICIAITQHISWLAFFGNLFMLQNDGGYGNFTVPLFVNFPTWSLNYEVVYYLIFIPLFRSKPKVWHLLAVMILLTLLLLKGPASLVWFTNYLNGFYFWILGLAIGWGIISGNPTTKPIHLFSFLFLHMCQNHLGLGRIVLNTLGISSNTNFNWLFDLPFCLMIMAALTHIDNRILRINKVVVYITPLIVLLYLTFQNRLLENERWIMCAIFWLLSMVFLFEEKLSSFLMEKLTVIGKISYALYLLHVPVALAIKKIVIINDPAMGAAVKFTLWLGLTFAAAVFFDLYYQPKIKKLFYKVVG